jgi:hypothetical protein
MIFTVFSLHLFSVNEGWYCIIKFNFYLNKYFFSNLPQSGPAMSVSRFQEKEKRGEMITINENIK